MPDVPPYSLNRSVADALSTELPSRQIFSINYKLASASRITRSDETLLLIQIPVTEKSRSRLNAIASAQEKGAASGKQ